MYNKLVRLIALQYAARRCKQNKRYHTSARLTLAYKKTTSVHGTDGQTDRRTDRVRRNMRPPPREEGRIIKLHIYTEIVIALRSNHAYAR